MGFVRNVTAISGNIAIHITGAPARIAAGIAAHKFPTGISIQISMTGTATGAALTNSNLIVLVDNILHRGIKNKGNQGSIKITGLHIQIQSSQAAI